MPNTASILVGEVEELWRYPVKSMAGESLETAELTESGIVGDRIVQVRNGAVHILMDSNGLEVRCFSPCQPTAADDLRQAQAPDHNKDEKQQ